MSRFTTIELVYFLGIGGIGMSALARHFHHSGVDVCGYDRTPSALTTELEFEGISVSYADNVLELPALISALSREKVLVVYTPAMPTDSRLLNWFRTNGYPLRKRSEVLGELTTGHPTIAIAGTHGKTTTSALTAHLLYASNQGCNAFIGGIMANYGSNHLFSGEKAWFVVEADEFDRSFLQLTPQMAVITSADADHLDIYGSDAEVKQSFNDFAQRINKGGTLLVCDRAQGIEHPAVQTYGFSESATWRIVVSAHSVAPTFSIFSGDAPVLIDLPRPMPGRHNLENTAAAVIIAHLYGLDAASIVQALQSFRGIHRRFEYQLNTGDVIFIDDYAHHPEELRATITAVREHHPGKRITGVFQPHLYSRTRDFGDDFARSLALLDEVVLLDIYPAREQPLPGIDSQWLLDKINHPYKKHLAKSQLLPFIRACVPEVLLTLGAGDIDREVEPIRKMLEALENEA